MVLNKNTLTYDLGISYIETDFFEKVGMQLYVEFGYDRYDYSKNGSPVDIPLIKRDYEEAVKLGFTTGYDSIRDVACGIVEMYESE